MIFSAAHNLTSMIRQLWYIPGVVLISSSYAVEEARRNLLVLKPSNILVLDELLDGIDILSIFSSEIIIPALVDLPEKDVPILAAAIGAGCTHLLTGDKHHFGDLFGKSIDGVLILKPSDYIKQTGLADRYATD